MPSITSVRVRLGATTVIPWCERLRLEYPRPLQRAGRCQLHVYWTSAGCLLDVYWGSTGILLRLLQHLEGISAGVS